MNADPIEIALTEHQKRRDERLSGAGVQGALANRLALARGLVFFGGLALWYLALGPRVVPAWTVLASAVVFLALVAWHRRVTGRLSRLEAGATHHESRAQRLLESWEGQGDPGEDFRDPKHPFGEDLDLFGPGSLFERLSTSWTALGRRALAEMLASSEVPAEEVRRRQRAVAELRLALDLREDLALLAASGPGARDAEVLRSWASQALVPFPRGVRVLAVAVSALAFSGLGFWLLGDGPAEAFLLSGLAVAALTGWCRAGVARALEGTSRAERLHALSGVAHRLQQESFRADELRDLASALTGAGPALRRLARLLELYESRLNPLFALLAPLLLFDLQVALSLESWRARHAAEVPSWLQALGRLEALCAVSAYAYENPDDVFPELVEDEGAVFDASGLGHPLIPRARLVRNELCLDSSGSLLLVSGSNMSGKSTLLRAVGLAVVLTGCGAPVRARRLRLSRLAVGASIRVQDSVREGRSRFYAEIARLKQILDLARARPTLFLLDEVLSGTNSADRQEGAEAVVRGLLAHNSIGLVTTHDLALARIAETLAPRADNVHFEDRLADDGSLSFDYRMRPGVVTRSNALALMRAVGLEVPLSPRSR